MNRPSNQSSSGPKVRSKCWADDSASDDRSSISAIDPAAPKGDTRNRFLQETDAALDDTNLLAADELDGSGRFARVLYSSSAKDSITHDDIADHFLVCGNEAGDPITNLRLQKLVYYAQAWYLANYEKPLFSTDFEAWVHGPVMPELYHKYKGYKSRHIETELSLEEVERRFDEDTLDFLEEVAEIYMAYTAYNLERMTHHEDPWIAARGDLPRDAACTNVISKESMRDYYAQRLKEED